MLLNFLFISLLLLVSDRACAAPASIGQLLHAQEELERSESLRRQVERPSTYVYNSVEMVGLDLTADDMTALKKLTGERQEEVLTLQEFTTLVAGIKDILIRSGYPAPRISLIIRSGVLRVSCSPGPVPLAP